MRMECLRTMKVCLGLCWEAAMIVQGIFTLLLQIVSSEVFVNGGMKLAVEESDMTA
ncbi:hypothetical protein YC2023_007249 [Brassica napus]